MRRRGRPPYPDILTPRQWEVLDYLREGLTDPEIAQRLGVSLDGAKYHVSEILSKLGVSSREEAARWEPEEERVPVSGGRRKVLLGAFVGAILAAAAIGVGVLVVGTVNSGTGDDAPESNEGPPQTIDEFVSDLEQTFEDGSLARLFSMYTPEYRSRCSLSQVEEGGVTLPAISDAQLTPLDTPVASVGADFDFFLRLHSPALEDDIEVAIPTIVDGQGIWIAPGEGGPGCAEQFATLAIDTHDTGAAGEPPQIDQDNWHAPYEFIACGVRQPNAPMWEGVGVHTHGDGVIHIHPFTSAEEGLGARLTKWFFYGGGELDNESVRLPGLAKTWTSGEVRPSDSPDAGQSGAVQVFANGDSVDLDTYIPQDGDLVKVVFGPPDDGQWVGDVPTVVPEATP